MEDKINPPHYKTGDIECIEAIEAAGYGVDFCAGNAMKYLWRFKHKGNALGDAQKARWYIERLVQQLEITEAYREAEKEPQ